MVMKSKRIKFSIEAPDAHQVLLVGTFNQWSESADPMQKDETGVWKKAKILPLGKYEYKFIIDGEWIIDPGCSNTKVLIRMALALAPQEFVEYPQGHHGFSFWCVDRIAKVRVNGYGCGPFSIITPHHCIIENRRIRHHGGIYDFYFIVSPRCKPVSKSTTKHTRSGVACNKLPIQLHQLTYLHFQCYIENEKFVLSSQKTLL